MKLKDIKAEEAIEVVADILIPIGTIAMDPKFRKVFSKVKVFEGEDAVQKVFNYWQSFIPSLLKEHKKDIIEILAAINLTTAEKYKEKNSVELIRDIYDMINDEDLIGLFTSALPGKEEGRSGGALEITSEEV